MRSRHSREVSSGGGAGISGCGDETQRETSTAWVLPVDSGAAWQSMHEMSPSFWIHFLRRRGNFSSVLQHFSKNLGHFPGGIWTKSRSERRQREAF